MSKYYRSGGEMFIIFALMFLTLSILMIYIGMDLSKMVKSEVNVEEIGKILFAIGMLIYVLALIAFAFILIK